MNLPSEPVRRSLMHLQGSIWRHTSDQPPELLCMATQLCPDYVVTVYDKGVDNFETKPPHWNVEACDTWRRPHHRFTDLRLHSHHPGHRDDVVKWLYWAALCPIQPLIFLSTVEKPCQSYPVQPTASMDTLLEDRYPKLWRIGYGRGILDNTHSMLRRNYPDDPYKLEIRDGVLINDVTMTYFRGGADNLHNERSLVAHANFAYPGDIDYGAPVVTDDGWLAGILVGGDLGSGSSHQGAYVPIDLVIPFLHHEHARRKASPGFRMTHHTVIHHDYPS